MTGTEVNNRGLRRFEEGVVVSNKMQKTVVVSISRQIQDAKYGKYLNRRSRRQAHDENSECKTGDLVRIEETRPISKHKSWKVVKVLRKAE